MSRTGWWQPVAELDAAVPIDREWLQANPLPQPGDQADKNARGRVMTIGGGVEVPGGIRLTAEAALRAGAGKVRVATVAPATVGLGAHLPEVALMALPFGEDGEIDAAQVKFTNRLAAFDAIVIGPAMCGVQQASLLLSRVLEAIEPDTGLVIDAAALMDLAQHREALRALPRPALLTPHIGEMAALLGASAETIEQDRAGAVQRAAKEYHAVVMLKGATSVIAGAGGSLFRYDGGLVGLATGGSGDVLAGIAGALMARGAEPLQAMAWAVWIHGEAGQACGRAIAPLGFLASELLSYIPRAMHFETVEPQQED